MGIFALLVLMKTIDRETAEHINAQYQFEYIMNMDSHVLDQWLYEYGLSKLEAAMIQLVILIMLIV